MGETSVRELLSWKDLDLGYQCFLDDLDVERVPRYKDEVRDGRAPGPLVKNPGLRIQQPGQSLADIDPRLGALDAELGFGSRIKGEGPVLWVTDPGTGLAEPYGVRPESAAALKRLLDEPARAPRVEDERLHSALVDAKVLVDQTYVARRTRQWDELRASAVQTYRERECVILRNLLNPLQLSSLRSYLRHLHEQGIFWPDLESNRVLHHNLPVLRLIHGQLTPLLDAILPEAVKPSYCMVSVYGEEGILEKHTDREQCRINVSLVLDMEPEEMPDACWPIYVETRAGVDVAKLGLGDAVVYPGSLPHWRDRVSGFAFVTLCFFHFVSIGFGGKLD
jgi:hypothetical protein